MDTGKLKVPASPSILRKDGSETRTYGGFHRLFADGDLAMDHPWWAGALHIGVPVMLVIADLERRRCPFACLIDYIDKILIPKHDDYRAAGSRAIHVPLWTEIGTDIGMVGLRWYAKRAKLLAAFQRFAFQYSKLQSPDNGDWRKLTRYFGERIIRYDFWDDTEMCEPIRYHASGLRRFMETGKPGYFKVPGQIPDGVDPDAFREHYEKLDIFELWRLLALLPKTYEDV